MASGTAVEMDFQYQCDAEVKTGQLEREGESMRIALGDRVYDVKVQHSRAGELIFTVDGVTHTAFVASEGATRFVAVGGDVFELKKPEPRRTRRKHHQGEDSLTASMPGQITKVLVNTGDVVQRGQPLIVLEAMKMEIKIAAPRDGRVMNVLVQSGQVVDRGQGLIEIDQE